MRLCPASPVRFPVKSAAVCRRFRGRGQRYRARADWLAGAGGFEPPYGGIKIRCLTTWLRPTTQRPGPARGDADCRPSFGLATTRHAGILPGAHIVRQAMPIGTPAALASATRSRPAEQQVTYPDKSLKGVAGNAAKSMTRPHAFCANSAAAGPPIPAPGPRVPPFCIRIGTIAGLRTPPRQNAPHRFASANS